MPSLRTLYPGAYAKRVPHSDPSLRKARRAFFKSVSNNFVVLQLLFLGLFCYIFGALFQQTNHTHNLTIAFVDYDEGAIGHAVRSAYASLQGPSFPTLIERPPSDIPSTPQLWQTVCKTDYWAALYISPGSSDRLQTALTQNTTTTPYSNKDILSYIWNEALYAPVIDASISAPIALLSSTARIAYTRNLTTSLLSLSPTALSILADPWSLTSLNIQPTSQGSRAIYNTIVIVLVLIQEFFYLGTINGLYAQFRLYSRLSPQRIAVVRTANSLVYTLVGSLCVAGSIYAFRAGWEVEGKQLGLSWMVLWLFAHGNFLVLDVFTIWVPGGYVPMCLISWVIVNITSVVLPFELSPGWYRVGYGLPAHAVYQVLVDVWSRGCNPQLGWALPVLFAWEGVGLGLSLLGVWRRCHFAVVGEEVRAREERERLDTAVGVHLERMREREGGVSRVERVKSEKGLEGDGDGDGDGEREDELRNELADALEKVETRQRREKRKGSVPCNFGPSFDLPFQHGNDSDQTLDADAESG